MDRMLILFINRIGHVVMGAVLEEMLQYFHRDYSDGGLLISPSSSDF